MGIDDTDFGSDVTIPPVCFSSLILMRCIAKFKEGKMSEDELVLQMGTCAGQYICCMNNGDVDRHTRELILTDFVDSMNYILGNGQLDKERILKLLLR